MRRILGMALAGLVTLGVMAPAAHADRYYRRGGYRDYGRSYYRHGHSRNDGLLGGLIVGGVLGYVVGRESSRDRYYTRDRYDDRYYGDRYYGDRYYGDRYYDRGRYDRYDDCAPPRRVYERRIIEEDYYRPTYRRYERYDY